MVTLQWLVRIKRQRGLERFQTSRRSLLLIPQCWVEAGGKPRLGACFVSPYWRHWCGSQAFFLKFLLAHLEFKIPIGTPRNLYWKIIFIGFPSFPFPRAFPAWLHWCQKGRKLFGQISAEFLEQGFYLVCLLTKILFQPKGPISSLKCSFIYKRLLKCSEHCKFKLVSYFAIPSEVIKVSCWFWWTYLKEMNLTVSVSSVHGGLAFILSIARKGLLLYSFNTFNVCETVKTNYQVKTFSSLKYSKKCQDCMEKGQPPAYQEWKTIVNIWNIKIIRAGTMKHTLLICIGQNILCYFAPIHIDVEPF